MMRAVQLDPDTVAELCRQAEAVAARAYAPASGFPVGAALLGEDGRIFVGCNVENASYGLSICAERSAVFQAVAAGCRSFVAAAVHTDCEEPGSPCGACRQVLAEFAGPDCALFLVGRGGRLVRTSLGVLLPRPFGFADLERRRRPEGRER
jgi:cytidine deaminase